METTRIPGALALPGAVLLGLAWGFACQSHAQAPVPVPSSATTQLTGQVLDEQGAVLPGASVTFANLETGVQRRTTADGEGRFLVSGLPVGEYRVTVEVPGFQVHVVDRVKVTPSMTQSLMIRFGGGPVPVVSPSPPMPVPSAAPPKQRNFAVFDWNVSGEAELLQRLESLAETGWALSSVVAISSQRGFFHFEKATGTHYELVRQDEPLKVEDLRQLVEQRAEKRLVGAHRLTANAVLLIFRSTP